MACLLSDATGTFYFEQRVEKQVQTAVGRILTTDNRIVMAMAFDILKIEIRPYKHLVEFR